MKITLELDEEDVEWIASILHHFDSRIKTTEVERSIKLGNEITRQLLLRRGERSFHESVWKEGRGRRRK